jgi:hypothetical protein
MSLSWMFRQILAGNVSQLLDHNTLRQAKMFGGVHCGDEAMSVNKTCHIAVEKEAPSLSAHVVKPSAVHEFGGVCCGGWKGSQR